MIHEDDVEYLFAADVDGLLSGCNCRNLHAVAREYALGYNEVHGLIVNYECTYAVAAQLLSRCFLIADARIKNGYYREAIERFLEDLNEGVLGKNEVFVSDNRDNHIVREFL